MEESGVTFFVVFMVSVQSAPSGSETIWLKDVTSRIQTDKRTIGDLDLLDQLTFHLRRGTEALTLNLEKNYDINPNTGMYFARKVKDGRIRLMKTRSFYKEDVAYYQDMENDAFMTVRCVRRSSEACDRVVNGNIQIGGNSYNIRPIESDVNVLEVPGLHGKRYFLEDIVSIRRENSDKKKEVENVEVTRVEEDSIDRHRRLFGQNTMFSYQGIATLNNIGEICDNEYSDKDDREGKTRQLKKKYYVDVAVMIDSSIWDLYASRLGIPNLPNKREKVKASIREAYSHIMNGVNLLYKGIQDTSISIKVTLSAFIFFQQQAFFPHKRSQVSTINGKTHISAYFYLEDLDTWDETPAAELRPSFDHVMLFTRHNLDGNYISNDTVTGISYDGGVCDSGERTSVVKTTDYVRTAITAAHELGHNLGAFHDGEKDAVACDPKDYFIMTPITLLNRPGMTYNKNRWLFSNCSVESFKKTLITKHCVQTKGKIYDQNDWKGYIMKMPGDVYSPNDQCYFINGPNSVYVGPVTEDICYLMRCTDPRTQQPLSKYFYAATGTKCGNNKKCIEGRCVLKG